MAVRLNPTALPQFQSSRVFGLIEADDTASWQPNAGERTPSLFHHGRTVNALCPKRPNFSREIFAHEIELVLVIHIRRMKSSFGWRQREDQPSMPGIDRCKAEHLAEKLPVRFGVLAVQNYMRARYHLPIFT
jgi:hypothetical protein